MVVEREPPKTQSSPSKTDHHIQHRAIAPAFGQTTSLQSPLRATIFNIPKANKVRPEHHRVDPAGQPHDQQSNRLGHDFIDPFRPPPSKSIDQVHVIPDDGDDDDVQIIAQPSNPATWASYPAGPATYSSLVKSIGGFASSKQQATKLDRFTDLTDTALFEDKFGAADPYEFVDAAKANENIKALLEGAFEDEEDKPKTRGRKKKLEANAAGLLEKLQGLGVTAKETKKETEQEGDEEEEEEEEDGSIEGLKVKLLPHQVAGVDWMRDKEAGLKKKNRILPKGGILADDMGLGKTIQSIALLLINPRPPISSTNKDQNNKEEKRMLSANVGKSTLVVAPLALIKQWEAEISNRVEDSHKLRVCVHHGPQRTKRFEDLRKYDVVITTYQILVSEHGSSSQKQDGPQVGCFGLHWYRVILDEAHTIKNRNAKATQACYALRAEYRWCLTGTPMQNNLDELQSLIRFLRIKPYNELAVWREQITRPMTSGRGGVAMKRLQFYLKAFMKRRTKDVLKAEGALNPGGKADVAGKPSNGFKITERRIEKVVADFTTKERTFYDRLEQRTDRSLEQMMGGQKLNYASALVLLLRLRQACNHPELVGGSMAKDKDALTTGQTGGTQTPRRSKTVDNDVDDVADLLGGLSVQTKKCDVCQIELTKEEASSGSIRCGECEVDLQEQKVDSTRKKKKKPKSRVGQSTTKTREEMRRSRSSKTRRVVVDSDDEEEGGDWIVPKGQRHAPKLGRAGGSDDENAEGGGEWLASEDSETGDEASIEILGSHDKKHTSDVDSDDESAGSSSASEDEEGDIYSSDEASEGSLASSTKIQHLLKILHRESPTHKFIVFSQFTSMLDLIEPFLKSDGLVFTRYDGSMRNDHREASLERLRNEEKTRILLCSLKCGSLGLNLTAASRVVILEPFWNPFVEEQAIDRVHRLNQTVNVIVYKITIANSVEERILDLQEKKRALAEAAIEGKAVGKLSMDDILKLFRREAEHDDRHEDHGLGARGRILPPAVEGVNGGKRVTPPAMERPKDKGKAVREDPIYARRW
ncbi:MAG: hypothetical protein Q9187_003290 [Circinaria calcarea]